MSATLNAALFADYFGGGGVGYPAGSTASPSGRSSRRGPSRSTPRCAIWSPSAPSRAGRRPEVREASDDDERRGAEQDGDLFSLGAGVQGLLMGDSSDDSDSDDDGAAPADDGEAWVLTPLGRHVADLPMDCRVAKLLIYGAIFGAAEPCLTLAAGMSLPKGVFVAPFHKRKEAAAAAALRGQRAICWPSSAPTRRAARWTGATCPGSAATTSCTWRRWAT
ncbi:hypothetical protein JL720_15045 [Aureococcus anophagefferens]|nr:hypothetical protein JL720_15045 [Aureococcus anophagefferens]